MSAATLLPILAAMLAAERERVVKRLREAGALRAEDAVPLEFRRGRAPSMLGELLRTGEVGRTADGRYWLDEAQVDAVAKRQVRKLTTFGLGLIGVALAGLGVALIANR